jgi:thiamine biosynthesis protein ThiS
MENPSVVFTLTVNGRPHTCPRAQVTLAELLEEMTLTGKRIAVEVNGAIVPRSAFATTALAAGDKLEIVGAVGGG